MEFYLFSLTQLKFHTYLCPTLKKGKKERKEVEKA